MPGKSIRISLSILAATLAAAANAEPRLLSAPPVFLFVGDDSDTLAAYAEAVPEHRPQGVTLSTRLTDADPRQTLPGVFSAAGATDFGETLAAFPDAKLAVGLSLSDAPECRDTHTAKIAAGDYDQSLGALADFLAGLKPRAVFLRIGPEFDGPWNCYAPEPYKRAFRKIHEVLEERGADNVVTVWHSAAWPRPAADEEPPAPESRERWYPGDDVVDWIALSVFALEASRWSEPPAIDPAAPAARVVARARNSGKPAMIATAAPRGLRIAASTVSPLDVNAPEPAASEELWEVWYRPFFDFVHANRDVVRIVSYANTHWDASPRWRCEAGAEVGSDGCPRGLWGDSRVQADPVVEKKWLTEILDGDVWFQGE